MKSVSFIFPIYNEEPNVELLWQKMVEVTSRRDYVYEFIFVNDGSSDASYDLLIRLHEQDSRVVVVDFSRNFGHQLAVTAGLDIATGEAVIIMDSDMQDPPEVALELLDKWEDGWDVIYAQRRSRKDGFFKKASASLFYRALQELASIDIPRDTGDFRLLDRRVVDELKRYREHDRFLRGMVAHVGFRQTAVQFDRQERYAGETGYPLRKMVKFALDGIFGFSSRPLELISRVGFVVALFAVVGIVYALARRIFSPAEVVSGWTFVIITILLVGGIQLIMMGIIGQYLGRVYTQVQGRPLYTVRQVLPREANSTQHRPTLRASDVETLRGSEVP